MILHTLETFQIYTSIPAEKQHKIAPKNQFETKMWSTTQP